MKMKFTCPERMKKLNKYARRAVRSSLIASVVTLLLIIVSGGESLVGPGAFIISMVFATLITSQWFRYEAPSDTYWTSAIVGAILGIVASLAGMMVVIYSLTWLTIHHFI